MAFEKKPQISIITPILNAADHLIPCLESVISQGFHQIEHVLIDGRSTDGSLEIIKQYATNHSHITFISEPDSGIYDAMNKGIGLASGEWLYFMGSDDVFYNSKVLLSVTKELTREYVFVYGNVLFKHSGKQHNGEYNREKLAQENICHQSIFYHRSLFSTYGGFNTTFRFVADYDFNLRVWADETTRVKYLDCIVAVFNESGESSKSVDTEFYSRKNDLLLDYDYFCHESYRYARDKLLNIIRSSEYRLGSAILGIMKRFTLKIRRLTYKRK